MTVSLTKDDSVHSCTLLCVHGLTSCIQLMMIMRRRRKKKKTLLREMMDDDDGVDDHIGDGVNTDDGDEDKNKYGGSALFRSKC